MSTLKVPGMQLYEEVSAGDPGARISGSPSDRSRSARVPVSRNNIYHQETNKMNQKVLTIIAVIVVVTLCASAVIYFPSISEFMRGLMHGG